MYFLANFVKFVYGCFYPLIGVYLFERLVYNWKEDSVTEIYNCVFLILLAYSFRREVRFLLSKASYLIATRIIKDSLFLLVVIVIARLLQPPTFGHILREIQYLIPIIVRFWQENGNVLVVLISAASGVILSGRRMNIEVKSELMTTKTKSVSRSSPCKRYPRRLLRRTACCYRRHPKRQQTIVDDDDIEAYIVPPPLEFECDEIFAGAPDYLDPKDAKFDVSFSEFDLQFLQNDAVDVLAASTPRFLSSYQTYEDPVKDLTILGENLDAFEYPSEYFYDDIGGGVFPDFSEVYEGMEGYDPLAAGEHPHLKQLREKTLAEFPQCPDYDLVPQQQPHCGILNQVLCGDVVAAAAYRQ